MDTQVNAAILQIISTIKGIANPIGVLSVVLMGLYLIFGHDEQTLRKIKMWALCVVVGLVLINMAEPIVTWLQTIG